VRHWQSWLHTQHGKLAGAVCGCIARQQRVQARCGVPLAFAARHGLNYLSMEMLEPAIFGGIFGRRLQEGCLPMRLGACRCTIARRYTYDSSVQARPRLRVAPHSNSAHSHQVFHSPHRSTKRALLSFCSRRCQLDSHQQCRSRQAWLHPRAWHPLPLGQPNRQLQHMALQRWMYRTRLQAATRSYRTGRRLWCNWRVFLSRCVGRRCCAASAGCTSALATKCSQRPLFRCGRPWHWHTPLFLTVMSLDFAHV
jgi:hypothetical protein